MKKVLALILSLAMVLCLIPAVATATGEGNPVTPQEEPTNLVEIKVLGTSDIHGQLFATDYTADAASSGTYRRGLTRLSTYVNEQRAAYDNVLLMDTGDLVQGTPLTYYYAFYQETVDDPAMKALRTMGYDIFVPGNHEFNYGMTILQRQLNYLTSAATETEAQVAVSCANYLADETNNDDTKDWATWNGYAPYIIKEYDGVKVAIMGIGNPNVAKWDVPANWDGIYFANPIETYLHYEAEMVAAADIIIIASHSGINSDEDSDYMERLIQQTNTIDLVYAGHEHFNKVTEIENSDGDIVPVVSPYTKCRAIGDTLLTYNTETGELTVDAKVVNTENLELDEALVEVLKPYETATWENYMNEVLGTADGAFSALNLGTAPSAFMDLINAVQIWGAYDNTGENTPDDPSDDRPAQLSISAPLTSGDATELIPEGEIKLGDMFRLYRYENWFYQITMSGKEVKTWLEFAATKIQTDANGNPTVSSGDLTYYDVIYGAGFSYVIDYTAEAGSRVISMTYFGSEVLDDDEFTVVINNYRYNGGGNYVAYLNENGCEFIANDEDRIIYSTQYDMMQGEDKGQARNLLADYIREQEVISPIITSTWRLVSNADFILSGEQGLEIDYEHDDDGYLLWDVRLSELPENTALTSLQFDLAWDNTELELVGYIAPVDNNRIISPEINTDKGEELTTASELYYAFGSEVGVLFPDDVVLTLMFKVKDAVADGTQMDIAISNFRLSIVEPIDGVMADVDMTNMQFATVDGYITAQNVDKSQLQALYNADSALYNSATITDDLGTVEDGTMILSTAEGIIDANALAAALAVLNDPTATQAEVDAAYAALLAAFIAPHEHSVDTTLLELAIAYALEFMDSAEFDKCSDELQKEWEDALAAALAVLADPDKTQNECTAAAELIYSLEKTGESAVVIVFAGITLLAVLGLGYSVRRRFN
ncbi:MAG: 5'-nucleotidase C-terminal domain-containing protein [Clostridia bacterium]|nr:5'-nucleotidase C-terminal domain-containing protein [Clostridia bacterium]